MPRVHTRFLVLVVLIVLGGNAPVFTQPDTREVLGIRIGPRLAELMVPASGGIREAALPRHAGQEVIVIVQGTFVYSQRPGFPPGQQDAKYRWGSRLGPGEKVCWPCTDPNAEVISFVIDGRYREPLREDFGAHVYVYVHRVADTGTIRFQIRDDNYSDNQGGLQVSLHEKV